MTSEERQAKLEAALGAVRVDIRRLMATEQRIIGALELLKTMKAEAEKGAAEKKKGKRDDATA